MFLPLALARSAFATTLAVLPFEPGVAGDEWDGLGTALAGMVVTDLADAPGVTLVERERVDALLDEIALGEQGFTEAATAAKLGKGLGADLLVLGGYSVVGGTFRLDARLVDPASGEVRQSAAAEGTVDEFSKAEKALVEAVLADLDVVLAEDARARLIARVPTTRLDALAAFGQGEALSREGLIEEARRAYDVALAADPAFALAKNAVVRLSSRVDAMAAERMAKASDDRSRRFAAVLAAVPDERTKSGTKDKPDALEQWIVRLHVLRRAGLDCDAYAEMRHYLDRKGWTTTYPRRDYRASYEIMGDVAGDLGLADPDDAGERHELQFSLSQPLRMLGDVGGFLYLFPDPLLSVESSEDMLHTGLRCFGPVAFADEVDAIRAEVEKRGLGATFLRGSDSTLTLSERLELSAIALRARSRGLTDAESARVVAIIDAHPDKDTAWTLEGTAKAIALADHLHYLDQAALLGLSAPEIQAVTRSWGDGGWVDPSVAHCAAIITRTAPIAASWKDLAEREQAAGRGYPTRYIAPYARALVDVGCVRGAPSRFATPSDALAWIVAGRARLRPDAYEGCSRSWESLPGTVLAGTWDADVDWTFAYSTLVSYYSVLVASGCVSDPVVNP